MGRYSETALKLYALQREGSLRSNAGFWRDCSKALSLETDLRPYVRELEERGMSLVCAFDEDFPRVELPLRMSERPYLFAYRGEISLLKNLDGNVAVVGVLDPSNEVIARERKVVRRLVEEGFVIVSGLARGCDTVAHAECLACGGRTVAFLPSSLSRIYPRGNEALAEKIAAGGGLVVTEYMSEARTWQEGGGRFIARDRLQAMFSSRAVLIASYLKGEGDSGSRHAMQKAKEYGRERLVMYREEDFTDPQFGLNRRILQDGGAVLTANSLVK